MVNTTVTLVFQPDFVAVRRLWKRSQKIDAAASFLVPRMDFILRVANVAVTPLNALNRRVKKIVKGWMNLPQRA